MIARFFENKYGSLENAGSTGGGWRGIDWTVVKIRRGDCAGVRAGGLRRSIRVPIVKARMADKRRAEDAQQALGRDVKLHKTRRT
jgi:hypothetical protein